jgi:hypothetical protein
VFAGSAGVGVVMCLAQLLLGPAIRRRAAEGATSESAMASPVINVPAVPQPASG